MILGVIVTPRQPFDARSSTAQTRLNLSDDEVATIDAAGLDH
jgi:hypothetical protein